MRLIDADALEKSLEKLWNVHDDQDFANKDVWREIENAPTAEPERRWISVTERLPEEDKDVLLLMAEGEMAVGQRRGVNYWDGYRRRAVIIAWMSLPEPWRGE